MGLKKLLGMHRNKRVVPDSGGQRVFPYVERIWFPYFLYTVEVASRKKGPGTMLLTVEAWSAAFAIFQLEEFIADGPLEDGEAFSPKLAIKDCETTARENLLHTVMRQRSRGGGKPIPGAIIAREMVHYPLWIYYYQRKKVGIDIKIVDGVIGRQIGHRTRTGVLEAFVAKKEAEESSQ
jgi:hypothetical protein